MGGWIICWMIWILAHQCQGQLMCNSWQSINQNSTICHCKVHLYLLQNISKIFAIHWNRKIHYDWIHFTHTTSAHYILKNQWCMLMQFKRQTDLKSLSLHQHTVTTRVVPHIPHKQICKVKWAKTLFFKVIPFGTGNELQRSVEPLLLFLYGNYTIWS